MGREVWIYKLKNEKVKKGLQKLLNDKLRFNYSFEDFLNSRQVVKNHLSVLKNIDEITPELLFEITYWLSEEINLSREELNNLLAKEMGIFLIYESNTKSEANSFMIAYHHYLDAMQKVDLMPKISDSGIITSSFEFIDFLDYFIFYLYKINTLTDGEKNNNHTLEMEHELDKIITQKANVESFINQVNSKFKEFKSLYKASSGSLEDIRTKNYTEFDYITRNFELTSKALMMKRKIKNEVNTVIIVDSK